MRVRRLSKDYGFSSIKETTVGEFLCLLVIAFVFAIVTGMVG
jgi:hypothetical protein